MTQPAAGSPGKRKKGNPEDRQRGETVRAVLAATVKPGQPLPLETVCRVVQTSHSNLLRHLAIMQETGRIRGYTTARGMVKVW
jgi:hypothetical protein